MKKLVLGTVVALAGIGVFASIGLGDGGLALSPTTGPERELKQVPFHTVKAPSVQTSATADVSRKGKPKVTYVESVEFSIDVGTAADVVAGCPKKFKALSGFYRTSGAVFADIFARSESSARRWDFGLANLTDGPASAKVGLVCGKKL